MAVEIDLTGKTILVCGVARGTIGAAAMRKVAAAGANVFIVDYHQDIVDEALADGAAFGNGCAGIAADLMDEDQTARVVPAVIERFGGLDGVANVTGGVWGREYFPLEATTTENFRATINLNLEYVFRVCRDTAASMIARGVPGSLVNVGSISALTSAPLHAPYGAAKAGVAALTRTMAFEWGRHGIRANSVSPGAVFTGTNADLQRDNVEAAGGDGRKSDLVWTSVDEMANGILFLLSDLASGISGQDLVIDSGLSTKFCGGSRELGIAKQVSRPTH